MSGRAGTSTLRLREVEVRRTPGITSGFRLTDLSPGLNIVYGPNASGKTTTAQVIQGLLWPEAVATAWPRAAFAGMLQVGDAEWRIDHDAGHRQCRRDGGAAGAFHPGVPAEHRERYLLSLHDLLQQENVGGPLAEVILRESAGGYDVPAAMRALDYRERPRRPDTLIKAVERARSAVRQAAATYEALQAEQARLEELRARHERAGAAAARASLLERALTHAAARQRLARAREQLAQFPDAMARLHGDEATRLARSDAALADAVRRRDEAARDLAQAQADAAATGLDRAELPPGLIERLRHRCDELERRARDIDQAATAHQVALTRQREARRRIAPDLSDDQIAALDRDGLHAYVEATDALMRVLEQERAEAELRAWLGDAEPVGDVDRLRQGVGLLIRWLRAPVRADAPGDARPTRAGLLAAGLVVVAGALLGVLVHPALWTLALAGVALGAAILLQRRPAPAGPWMAEAIQRDFERLDLGRPATWDVEEVEKLLGALIARLQAAELARQKAERWATLDDRRAALAAQRDRIAAQRAAIRQRYGLTVDGDVTRLALLASNVAAWQRAGDEVAASARAHQAATAAYRQALAELNAELAGYGYPATGDAATAAGHVEDLATRVDRLRQATSRAERAQQTLDDAVREIAQREAERAALLEPLGLTPDDSRRLEEWLARLEDYRAAQTAVSEAEGAARAAADALAGHPELLDRDPAQIEQEYRAQQALAGEQSSIAAEIGDIEGRIREAKRKQDLERALAEEADALDALRAAREQDYAAVAGWVLGDFVQNQTRDGSRPRVFHRARDLFARITQGRYQLEFDDGTPPQFRATDTATDEVRSLDQLSSATRLQLLMAVRLAFVEEVEQGVRLPLLLDETLGNSDELRASAIIDATVEICRAGRQVFYFTAQHDEVAKWQAVLERCGDVSHAVHDLAAIRQLADYQRLPRRAHRPVHPSVPPPGGMTRAQYRDVLAVPGVDRWVDSIGGVHLWHLVTDLAALHGLLSRGITTWGQAQNLAQRGLLAHFIADPAVYSRAAARARVLQAALDAYRIGRGKPVDRGVLLDSGAVSPTFIDRLANLARDLGGDARRLIAALRQGKIPRFHQAKLQDLEGYLAEHGYLDERDPLSFAEIRLHALNAAQEGLSAGRLSLDDVEELLAHFQDAAA
ncbi:MAG: hypothetical protein QJR03_07410 [Sphaerobacter sp.]|nr:hypothetical protein [Sphaerobacter sp.]